MKEIGQSKGTGVVLAGLAGAAAGAAVALLFAPCSGKETRNWLGSRTRGLKERSTAAYEQGKHVVQRAAMEIGKVAGDPAKQQDRPQDGKHGVPPRF